MVARKYLMFFLIIAFFSILELDAEQVSTNIKVKYFNNNSHGSIENARSEILQRKWVSQLFHQAQLEFQMDSNANTKCKRDFNLFKLHLQNQSLWAVKMLESSEWPLVGIISGAVDRFGNYDECLTISSYGIEGHYCLTNVIYDYPDTLQHEIAEVPDETISAWEALSMYQKNPIRVERNKLRFAICIPSSCKPVDLKISLNSTLNPIFKAQGLGITVDVNPDFCKIREDIIYPPGFYIVGCSMVALFLFVICCTFYDIFVSTQNETKNKGKRRDQFLSSVFQMFSISRNFRALMKVNPKTDYAALDLLKSFNMLAVIYSHRFIFSFSYPLYNSEVTERYYMGYSYEFTHQYIMVDTFFALSGFLKFHLDLSPAMKNGKFYIFFNVILRWIRMAPVFCVMILFIMYISPYVGDGPMWNHVIKREIANCKDTWWTNLLAINNIVQPDKQCLIVSWYMAVDIQLTILGGILLYIFVKNKKIGIFAVIFSFFVSMMISFTVAYLNHYDGLMKFTPRTLENIRKYEEFWNFYITTYSRCGPYLMGFMAAYVVKLLQERKFKFTNTQIYLLLLAAFVVTETNQYCGSVFYVFNRPYDRLENALYAALNRSISMIFYFVSFILYFTSGVGIFNKITDAKIWIPLGRLTYSVFLVNMLVQIFHISSQKQPLNLPTRINMIWWVLGDVILCYGIGLLLHLFVEAPIMHLRMILKRRIFCRVLKKESIPQVNMHSETFKDTLRDGHKGILMLKRMHEEKI